MKSLKLPLLLLLPFAFAQGQKDKQSAEQLDALVVESSPLDTKLNQTTQSVGILTGDELDKARASTIAGTLSDVPGVSQTQFGPSANRPIIRGQDKFRVKIVQNGTDTFSVSAQSEDHAVPIDPLLVDRIEILRGSSALLHGGSGIGGVVNVIDRSIPTDVEPVLSAFASYDINIGDNVATLFLRGNNLTDELAYYNHASLLKSSSPLAGRSVEVGFGYDF